MKRQSPVSDRNPKLQPRRRPAPLQTVDETAAQLPAKLQRAVALHRQGDLASARCMYEEILDFHPRHFDALHLLGVMAIQTRNPGLALTLIERAIDAYPLSAAAHCNRGSALEALDRAEAALSSFERALSIEPDYVEALFNRANVLYKLERYDSALAGYDRVIAHSPNLAQAHFNRGNALRQLRRLDDAKASYDAAIEKSPGYAEAHCNRGLALKEMHHLSAALADFERAIAIDPNYAAAHSNRGNVLMKLQQWDAALASYDRAIAASSDFAEAHFNRGIVLHELERFDEALADYDRAIAIRPDYAEAYSNRGNAQTELNRLSEALASYDHAIAMQPDYAPGWFNRSIALLLTGDFARGWHDYEWRWRNEAGSVINERREYKQPLWLGEQSLAGKTILLYGEQGLGDTIQFCRYVKLFPDLGARVVLDVKKPLAKLLANLDSVSHLTSEGDAPPFFDYHCPLLSLPLAFKTTVDTIPFTSGYLSAEPGRLGYWRARLEEKIAPRIGLVWSGNAKHRKDRKRSFALASLIPYLPGGVEYFCLQTELRAADQETLLAHPHILNFGGELEFDNTAALCECMDLVISVDTSVAHLSAALGKRTWILLPFNPDWRWLMDRSDSPWYRSVKLYRQRERGVWSEVFEQVRHDLTELTGA
jgi:tetratricopeptide (TPR) repeat protein